MLLKDKRVFITGAARGIGKATALICAEQGANLVLTTKSGVENLSQLKTEIESKFHVEVLVFKADVTNYQELGEVFKQLQLDKKYIDVLVNNAGIMIDAVLQMAKPELIEQIYRTNVFGTMYAAQFATKHFLKNRKGAIINLSSIIGTNGNHGQSIYGSSKTAVIGFTKSLAKELAPLQIRVNAVAPGFIDTDMTRGMDPKFYEKNIASIGMRRLGTPEDVAKVILFLASDLSEYVTGQVIGVDGGMVI